MSRREQRRILIVTLVYCRPRCFVTPLRPERPEARCVERSLEPQTPGQQRSGVAPDSAFSVTQHYDDDIASRP